MSKLIGDLIQRNYEQVILAAALLLSSAAGLSLLGFRIFYSGNAGYGFMPWNLFLAWIPLGLVIAMDGLRRGGRVARVALCALSLLWLLFFPNAPYLLTEFIHLDPRYAVSERPIRWLASVSPAGEVPVWYDAVLILTFAWNGLLLGVVSLRAVQQSVRNVLGAAWAWAVVVLVLALSAFGVSLGRFERWNSWDLFSQPFALIADVAARVLNPLEHARTTAVTVLFGSFLLLAYLSIAALAAAQSHRTPQRLRA